MFTEIQKRAIDEKLELLTKIKKGELPAQKLAELITKRRINWFEANKSILEKYHNLPDEEKAYRIICFDHMNINPEHSKMIRLCVGLINIKSYNFCPYLEACKQLGLDTSIICKEIGEPSIKELCRRINPNIGFSRDYEKLRPYNECCEEFFSYEI